MSMSATIKIISEVKSCSHCANQMPHDPNPVLQIHPNARILIAGQAPGRKVHQSGIPFDDASGTRLRQWLGVDKRVFYNPEQIAILPMAFCYPGSSKSGDLKPNPDCAVKWRDSVLSLMPDIRMTLLLGQYAQNWHLGQSKKHNLTETVKAWREYYPEFIPLPHPSPRNIAWFKNNPWFEATLIPVLQAQIKAILG